MAKKNQIPEKKVRKLRGQLRSKRCRNPPSRTMTDRQFKRLVAKTEGRAGNHRINKETVCQKNVPKKEKACVKEEIRANVFQEQTTPVEQTVKEETVKEETVKEETVKEETVKEETVKEETVKKCVKREEESEPAVEIVKVEPRRKVKSEPVVISLL
ncbi:hypothetical protein QBC32DRAFT_381509 [Pseudoneurospora amorphoporcata]|uniref:Uncharacterized protein n=1 Tax=Pseudoneurospora amorphoporcata TaxID=241081 RepID=A0AAN6NM23_9PEZI|nr:hypothetical protein QBC32DRAFT_381509 [Pseudoneurospora amorphoporcata]